MEPPPKPLKKPCKNLAKKGAFMPKKLPALYLNEGNEIGRAFYTCSLMTKKLIVMGLFKLVPKFDPEKFLQDLKNEDVNVFSFERYKVSFSKLEFFNVMGIKTSGTNYKEIDACIDSATKQIVKIDNDNCVDFIPWFSKASIDKKTGNISLIFNPFVMQAALDIRQKYANIELSKVGQLQSIYAIRYYEICKSFFNTKGKYDNAPNEWRTFELHLDYLRQLFQLDENLYKGRTDNFMKYVVTKPIEELNSISLDFTTTVEVIKRGRGGKIEGVILHCKEITPLKKIKQSDSKKLRVEKAESNNDKVKLELAKKMPEWKTISESVEENAKSKCFDFMKPGTLMFDIAVYTEMQKQGLFE